MFHGSLHGFHMLAQLANIVGEFFTEADRVGPDAAAQFRFFLQEKARRSVPRPRVPPLTLSAAPCSSNKLTPAWGLRDDTSCVQEQCQAGASSGLASGSVQACLPCAGKKHMERTVAVPSDTALGITCTILIAKQQSQLVLN